MKKFFLGVGVLVAALAAGESVYPYGVCAHVTRSERDAYRFGRTMDCMDLAGIRYVRSDFDARAVVRKDGTLDFSGYDALVDGLAARGMTLLPILYARQNPPEDLEQYRDYVRRIITHYGKKFPVVEIWNEANLDGFFRSGDPVAYARTLKAAYEAVKSVDPSIRVAFTGTAGVPLEWIRTVLANGAAQSFDIMNVHPYSHPARPEGMMDVQTERLRELLAEFGRGDAPIWFTEIGWPTHTQSTAFTSILQAGLKVARPGQKAWNVIMADLKVDGEAPDQTEAEALKVILPPGSTVRACTQAETCRLLAEGGVDAVVYPSNESFPADTIDAVNAFVAKGGVLVDFGGVPCYYGLRGSEKVEGLQGGAALKRFPFGFRAWWTDKKGTYPRKAQLFATEAGLKAGVKQEPTGFKALRFLAPDRIGAASEWIPLVAGKTTNGVELVSAAVVRYKGERTGAAVLCSLFARGARGTNSEENQARYTARGLGIGFAEGVEAYFTYNLRSFEDDPFYSEHHFGLMHADFQPKPAYAAYAAFTRERPAGSVQVKGVWHNKRRDFYYPQWTRPNGVKAGMMWVAHAEAEGMRTLRFTGGTPVFRNMYGRKIALQEVEKGVFNVPVTESPLYFSGAHLTP